MPSFVCPFIIGTYININKKENEKRSILFHPYHRIPHFRNDFRTGKQRQMEALDRGLVAVKTDSGVFISWRLSGNERDAAFNVYKNGKLFKSLSAGEATCLTDSSGKPSDKYVVRTIVNGKETSSSKEVTPWAEEFLTIRMNRPQGGTTPPGVTYVRAKHPPVIQEYPEGQAYTYVPVIAA